MIHEINEKIKHVSLTEESSYFDSFFNEKINSITQQDGVDEMLLLPDSLLKSKFRNTKYNIAIPSGSVITTKKETLYPQFKARGINCGMAVVALPFTEEALPRNFAKKLFSSFGYSPLYYAMFRLRLPFLSSKFDISKKDINQFKNKDLSWYAKRHNIDASVLKKIDVDGLAKNVSDEMYEKYISKNWNTKRTARLSRSFGRYFGGNHYMELQVVSGEEAALEKIGLTNGQIVVSYHTAGEGIESILRSDLVESYIKQKDFIAVSKGSEMYDAYMTAHNVLMNYGYAYRLAAFARIADVLKMFSQESAILLLDKPHNFIEQTDTSLVYRHNVEKLLPKRYALVSGTYNHPSYLVVGNDRVSHLRNSIDHGLGHIIATQVKNQDKERVTKQVTLTRFKKGLNSIGCVQKKEVTGFESSIADVYFEEMQRQDVCSKVATLTPINNMKFTK